MFFIVSRELYLMYYLETNQICLSIQINTLSMKNAILLQEIFNNRIFELPIVDYKAH